MNAETLFTQAEELLKVPMNDGFPVFVYDEKKLKEQAQAALQFPNAFGLTVRYAMKANPNRALLKLFDAMGLYIDASSTYEVHRAMAAGISTDKICLTAQEWSEDPSSLIEQGMDVNISSFEQLNRLKTKLKGKAIGLRFNPGLGSGGTQRTNVGGPSSSFGIWHEQAPEIKAICEKNDIKVERIHTHIGSGSEAEVWQKVAHMSLAIVEQFEDVHTLDLGGGYKVGRMPEEQSTDLQTIGEPVREAFIDFEKKHGRKLKLEIEPGTFLVAMAGNLVCQVQDKVDTGKNGYTFLKINAGMTDLLRPSLYGAQHPFYSSSKSTETESVIITGHCCESGDIFTPAAGDPEQLQPRLLPVSEVGDRISVGGAGAYCSSMNTKNYNSFPELAEYLRTEDGRYKLIRKRQPLEQIWKNEEV